MDGSVFISYSRRDHQYVRRLAAHLRDLNIDVWLDRNMESGDLVDSRIASEIDRCAVFLPVLSQAATTSRWVIREITRAQGRSRPIMPLRIEDCDVPLQLNDLNIDDVRHGDMPGTAFMMTLRHKIGQPPRTGPTMPKTRRLAIIISAVVAVIAGGGVAGAWINGADNPGQAPATPPAQTLPSPTTSATATLSTPPTATPVPAVTTANSQPRPTSLAPPIDKGTITLPHDQDVVPDCAYFQGTSQLRSGRTLILVKANVTTGSSNRFAERVLHSDQPNQLLNWRGAQFFGPGENSVGQWYRVQLMSVDANQAADATTDTALNSLASGGTELAHIEVLAKIL